MANCPEVPTDQPTPMTLFASPLGVSACQTISGAVWAFIGETPHRHINAGAANRDINFVLMLDLRLFKLSGCLGPYKNEGAASFDPAAHPWLVVLTMMHGQAGRFPKSFI